MAGPKLRPPPRWSVGLDRLRTSLDLYERELAGLRSRDVAHSDDHDPEVAKEFASLWWRAPADDLLAMARQGAAQRRLDAGWEALHSSQRLSLYDLTDEEIDGRRVALLAEAELRLAGWRQQSVKQLLQQPETWPPRRLAEAQRLVDEHSADLYLKLRLAGRRVTTAAVMLATAVIALGVAAAANAFDAVPVDGPFVLHDGLLFIGVVLLGVFGSMLSLALDLSRSAPLKSRMYELASAHIAVPVARVAIGAGSAVVTVAAAQTALVGGPQPWMFLTAIPAGFSERLVRRSVEALERGATEPDKSPPTPTH